VADIIGASRACTVTPARDPRRRCERHRGGLLGAGLLVDLSNEDAARFSFLLATPIVIGAAAALKVPDLLGTQGDHVCGQALVGTLLLLVSR
jgi:undecaprenyl pyrophosphate phosphatase UppP